MASLPAPTELWKTFGTLYAAGAALSVVSPGRIDKNGKLNNALAKIRASNRRNVRLALVPTLLPLVYRLIKKTLLHKAVHRHLGLDATRTAYSSALASALSSPVFLLLPKKLRVQLAVYALWSFLYSFARLEPSQATEKAQASNSSTRPAVTRRKDLISRWRDYLPPVWTLTVASNTWLLWAFLYHNYAFPQGYSKMITDHSQHYIPSQTSLPQFLEKLGSANHFRNSTGSGHHFFTCTILHPTQMSCTKNFVQAWIHETRRAAPWVTSFTALAILLRKKRAIFNAGASELLLELLDSTARGTAYITGSITTAWGISCLLQRVLPSRFMPRARWLLNGSLSNVWILLLGKSRQAAISLYIARLATLSLWKVWISKGGPSIRFGELLILIASWVGLDYVRAQGSIGSIMERTLSFVEGEDPPKAQISRNNNGGE